MLALKVNEPNRYSFNFSGGKKSTTEKVNVKPVDAKCELSGQEVRGIYGAFKALHEHTGNNPNAARGDLGPLRRELGKIKWYDCTEWDKNGKCKYPDCDGGLH
jgi:hypothetical protein